MLKNDILTNNSNIIKETELIEMKNSEGYSQLSKNEASISTSTSSELLEINNNNKIKYRKGNLYTFLYDEKGIPKIVIGPDWGYSLFLHIFIFLITFSYYIGLWSHLFFYIKIIGILIYFIFFITYSLTCIINPGIITPEYYLENYNIDKMRISNYRICSTCNAVQDVDKGVEHCVDCNICIIGNDHHCPWSSKCIGEKNINMFRYFICSIFLHIFFLMFASIFAAINDNYKKKEKFENK